MDDLDVRAFFTAVVKCALLDYRRPRPAWLPATPEGYKKYVEARLKQGLEPMTMEGWETYRRQRLESSRRVWALEKKEAKRWFMSKDDSYLCAYEHVCLVLDRDPEYLRKHLDTVRIKEIDAPATLKRIRERKMKTCKCGELMKRSSLVCRACSMKRLKGERVYSYPRSRFEVPYYNGGRRK